MMKETHPFPIFHSFCAGYWLGPPRATISPPQTGTDPVSGPLDPTNKVRFLFPRNFQCVSCQWWSVCARERWNEWNERLLVDFDITIHY